MIHHLQNGGSSADHAKVKRVLYRYFPENLRL